MKNFIEENRLVIQEMAEKYSTSPSIHESDYIFEFIVKNPSFENLNSAIEYYFRDGLNSTTKFTQFASEYLDLSSPRDLLEFASGYGCISRHLRKFASSWNPVSCDIHTEAMEFISSSFGLQTILSNSTPEKLSLDSESFDAVFCLSFFSHMPYSTWSRWLRRLFDIVKKGGTLIFTTHGHISMRYFNDPVLDDGFWFLPASEQGDLNVEEYGQTIVSPSFVCDQIRNLDLNCRIVLREGEWWGHQDLWILRKTK